MTKSLVNEVTSTEAEEIDRTQRELPETGSLKLDWKQDFSAPAWTEDRRTYMSVEKIDLDTSRNGAPQIVLSLKCLKGANVARFARKWLTVQAVSGEQLAFLVRDLLCFIGPGIQAYGDLKGLADALLEKQDAALDIIASAKGRCIGAAVVLRKDSDWPEIYPNPNAPMFDTLAAYRADPISSKS
jgi:hypothetical protein